MKEGKAEKKKKKNVLLALTASQSFILFFFFYHFCALKSWFYGTTKPRMEWLVMIISLTPNRGNLYECKTRGLCCVPILKSLKTWFQVFL